MLRPIKKIELLLNWKSNLKLITQVRKADSSKGSKAPGPSKVDFKGQRRLTEFQTFFRGLNGYYAFHRQEERKCVFELIIESNSICYSKNQVLCKITTDNLIDQKVIRIKLLGECSLVKHKNEILGRARALKRKQRAGRGLREC